MKKAQIRMGETIAVLIIFFFILILAAVMYVSYQKNQVQSDKFENIAKETVQVSQIVSYLPEIQCSTRNLVEDNCYDLYKLNAAKEIIIQNAEYYYPLFGYSEVVITEIYPGSESWVLYNRTDITSYPIVTNIPVLLHDPVNSKNSFAILTIAYYPYYGLDK